MKKKILFSTLIIAVISVAVVIYFQLSQKPLHKGIVKEDVLNIQVYGIETTEINDTILTDNIIMWFNNVSEVVPNNGFAGTTPDAGIIINLKSGSRIAILRSGKDFEVQRDNSGTQISYWAKQKDIKEYLDILATGEESLRKTIDEKLYSIVHNPKTKLSSNPYDHIKDNKDYEYIISQGNKAFEIMLSKFEKSTDNGIEEYIMAIACSEILGEKIESKNWSTGKEWYHSYIKSKRVN